MSAKHWQVSDEDVEQACEAWSDVYDGMPGSNAPSMRAALEQFLARKLAWLPMETCPPEGGFQVRLAEPMLGNWVHSAKWHPNVKTIGGVFSFDAPKPTGWLPLPPTGE
jgi:hypothetical protein